MSSKSIYVATSGKILSFLELSSIPEYNVHWVKTQETHDQISFL